jgi:uncharacterized Fe-S radical SAM superfamily protein PflX
MRILTSFRQLSLKYISDNYGEKVIVNIMDQYMPVWKAHLYPDISRNLTDMEFKKPGNLFVTT